MSWHADSACLGVHGFFYIENGRSAEGRRRIAACKAICAACPVLTQCRDEHALTNWPVQWHVIAGMSPREALRFRHQPDLIAERKRLARPRCGSERAYEVHRANSEVCLVCVIAHNQRTAIVKEAARERRRLERAS